MKKDIRLLLEIQRIDDEIAAEKEKQRSLREGLSIHRETVGEVKKRLSVAGEALLELKKEVDRKNLDIKEKEEQVEKDQTSLKQLSSNKEYKTMLTQIEKDRTDLSVLEDGGLDAMAKADKKKEEIKEIEDDLKVTESALAGKEAEVESLVASSSQSVGELEAKRAEIATGVDTEMLDKYEKLAGRAGGRVVVSSQGGMCGGCNMTIRAQMLSELMGDHEETICCTSCGRILYMEDE
ncbi:zinc ribbon domain-containing protein [Planctomycetota bacterium]